MDLAVLLAVDKLLGNLGEDAPSGLDREHDPECAVLEIAAQSKPEQQVGDQVIEAEDANYSDVMKLAPAILERSRDLRVAVYLAEAALNRDGFGSFAVVLEYVRRALEEYWSSVHPQLDEDDGDDPTERVNALLGLVKSDGVLRQLRFAPLCDGKVMGKFNLRHLAVVRGEMGPPSDMDETPDEGMLAAAFKDTPEEKIDEIRNGLSAAIEHVDAIESLLDDKVPGRSPDFSPLRSQLKTGLDALLAEVGGDIAPPADESPAAQEGGMAAPRADAAAVGGINSQSDVTRTIDLILDYYERNEPSSPVPLILARARRLVSADFMTIIKDIAASAEDEVRTIGGISAEDDY